MLVLSDSDSRIELDIVGYQFLSVARDRWDSEWLQVSGRVASPRGVWAFGDPCLTTFELKTLALWLRDVPVGGANRELGFTEPNLRFEHVEEAAAGDVLYVWLSQEASPPWATEAERYGEGCPVRIPFASIDFCRPLIANLRQKETDLAGCGFAPCGVFTLRRRLYARPLACQLSEIFIVRWRSSHNKRLHATREDARA